MRKKYGYAIAIAAAAILLMVSSIRHPIIGQQIRETIADAIEGKPTWIYYNQVRANKGLTPEEAREKGSRKFDGPDEDGNDPYERCEQQVANGEYDTILEAVLAEFDRTHRPSSGEADPARLGSTLTAHEEVIKSVDQSKLSDEEKQRLNLIVMPDEHDEVVGKRPNAFMNHAEKGMAGYEYAQKCYERMVENHKLATPSIEKIEDSYTSQTFQEPYSLEMGGNRPKVVVAESKHEGGYMLVWTYPDGTREEYRINCGFQWINTQNHGWTPVEWNPPSDNPPSKPDKPDEPDEPNEEKNMSQEMQSSHPGNSSVDGRNDESKDDKSDIPSGSAPSKTNPDTGRGENPGRPESKPDSGKSDKPNDEEASKGTKSGSKKSDETNGQTESKGDFTGEVTATDGEDRTDYGKEMDDNPPPVVPGANGSSGSGSGGSKSNSGSSSSGGSSGGSKSNSGGSSKSSSGGSSSSSSSSSSSGGSSGGSSNSSGSSSSSGGSSGGSSNSSGSSSSSSSSNSSSSSSSSSSSDGGHNKLEVDEDFDLD